MFRVLIAGAGGFGREIAGWIDGCLGANVDWKFAGYLNDALDALDGFDVPEKILGTITDYQPEPNDRIVIAIGDPATKLKIVERLRERGAKFLQLVHRSAVVCRGVKLGEGVIIAPLTYIGVTARIDEFVVLNVSATVGHDTSIGAGTILSGHCDVTGNSVLGRGVFMATHATVIPSITVGDDAYIGAGTVVLRNVPAGERVFGVPAKRVVTFGEPERPPAP